MTGGFAHLLSQGRLGSLELRNRIAMAPMGTNLGEADGTVGDADVAWFEARARGGAGLIIVGSVSVAYPSGSFDRRQTAASHDGTVPGLRRLTNSVHGHGAKVAAQLVHGGANSLLDIAEGRPLLVPSRKRPPPPDELSGMVTRDESAQIMAPFAEPTAAYSVREATADDLAAVVAQFADAADRARRAGFDGIELHGGHGYLLHAFTSPWSNRRDDRWGGSLEARAELLLTVVRAVRAQVGPDFPLWARLGAFEAHRDPGQRIDDALVTMGLAVDAGLDAVHVTAYGEPMVATGITDGHTPHRPGGLLDAARTVRRQLGVPVIAMGRLTPEAAEDALADGSADVIAMGRPLIADPELPAKLEAGRRDRVRPCAYQYRCIGSIFLNESVRCAVNPEAGHESEATTAASAPRHVVVAGGGPAGLECARRLAERGHRVELWEATADLGGRLALAELADPDVGGLLAWLIGAAGDAGVEIHLERTVDADVDADVLVWATGGDWSADEGALGIDDLRGWLIAYVDGAAHATADRSGGGSGGRGRPEGGADGPEKERTPDELLRVGRRVAVEGSSKAAVSLAAHAAGRGHEVTLAADDAVLAPELGLPGRFRLVADTRAAGVTIADGAVDADTRIQVRRGPGTPPPKLHGVEVHVIGDAAGTGGLAAALSAAAEVADRI